MTSGMDLVSNIYQRGYQKVLEAFAGPLEIIDVNGHAHYADAAHVTMVAETNELIVRDGAGAPRIIAYAYIGPAPARPPARQPRQPQLPQFTPGDGQVHD